MKNIKKILLALVLIPITSWGRGGDDVGNGGNNFLIRSDINQYTCLRFGNIPNNPNGNIIDKGRSAMQVYYYQNEYVPNPIEDNPYFVCHDDFIYGPIDSIEFPRLNLIENIFSLYSSFDSRFDPISIGPDGRKLEIDQIIQERMKKEYGIEINTNLFISPQIGLRREYGYLLKPIRDINLNIVLCPTNSTLVISPLAKIITEYTGNTQGLYYALLEKQQIFTGTGSQTSTTISEILVSETQLINYGFFIKNGVKNRISLDAQIEKETIYFYYPFSDTLDPLVKNGRKYATVQFYMNNANTKKVGCIFKSEN